MYAADNLSAYASSAIATPASSYEQLHLTGDQIQFTPHLLPIPRGILSTIYVRLNEPSIAGSHPIHCFDDFYAASPMVRVRRSPAPPPDRSTSYAPLSAT